MIQQKEIDFYRKELRRLKKTKLINIIVDLTAKFAEKNNGGNLDQHLHTDNKKRSRIITTD